MRGLARGNERNGNPNADLPEDDEPVDVAAVRRDDSLIDAIASDGPVATDSPEQYELALLLTNWRSDIEAKPIPAEPALDDVIAAMGTAKTRSAGSVVRGKLFLLRPIAGAAAAIAVIMGGATIFSYNAEPGDPLWGVKSVVFSQQAESTVARIDTTSQLEEAERMIAAGDAPRARDMLANAADRAGGVREPEVRSELDGWRSQLAAEVDRIAPTTPPEETTPPVPTTTDESPEATEPSSTAPETSDSTVPSSSPSPSSAAATGGPGEPTTSLPETTTMTSPSTPPESSIATVPSSPTEHLNSGQPAEQPSDETSPVLPTTTPTTPTPGTG
ncbi:anti-sigma-D factor RsdA [Rhodococcus sp. NPDC049939]|uniref:anti-sigma-D factor RsdA n=1 Tax=Rhodococcus sp. NPDC049939 TaxID=3155511 RepID=UPI0033CA8505